MTEQERRKQRNRDIIERMFRGETLATVPQAATWFPPRPIIQKNQEIISKLYGKDHTWVGGKCTRCGVLLSTWESDKTVCSIPKRPFLSVVE